MVTSGNKKGDVFLAETGTKDEVRELLISEGIDAIICNPNKQGYIIDSQLLKGTSVSIVNSCSTGTNHIDKDYCTSKNIEVWSLTKDYDLINQLPSTSELALTQLLALMRKLIPSVQHCTHFGWNYEPYIGRMASEMTVGVVGYGRLGKIMCRICKPLFKEVIVFDPYVQTEDYRSVSKLGQIFEECDAISLHVHVTDETRHMISREVLNRSRKSPILINTSRGEIVDERAIVEALESGVLSGYGTDVIEDEFSSIENSVIIKAMRNNDNIIVTPHTGGMTKEGQALAYSYAIDKFKDKK